MAKIRRKMTIQNYAEDFFRIAEIIGQISDVKDTKQFNKEFDKYMKGKSQRGAKFLKQGTLNAFIKLNQESRLKQDQERADTLRSERRQTRTREKQQRIKKGLEVRDFDFTGKVSGKTVFLEKVMVTIRGKKQTKYRDSKGRFGKPTGKLA